MERKRKGEYDSEIEDRKQGAQGMQKREQVMRIIGVSWVE